MLGFAEGKARAWLYKEGVVDGEEQTDEGSRLTVTWTATQKARFAKL